MNSTKKPFLVIATVLFTVMTISVNPAGAQAESAKPMALRGVMDKLGRDMQAITGAISKEEWAVVAELAPKIANHAEPPVAEKMRILNIPYRNYRFLSTSITTFPCAWPSCMYFSASLAFSSG